MPKKLYDDYFKFLEQIRRTPQRSSLAVEYEVLGAALGIEMALELGAGAGGFLSRWKIERGEYCNRRDSHTSITFSEEDFAQSDFQVCGALTVMLDYHEKQGQECTFPLDTRLLLFAQEMISCKFFMKWPSQTLFVGKGLVEMVAAFSMPRVCLYRGLTPYNSWYSALKMQHAGIASLTPADLSIEKRCVFGGKLSEDEARQDMMLAIDWFEQNFRKMIVL